MSYWYSQALVTDPLLTEAVASGGYGGAGICYNIVHVDCEKVVV
jgi:hypothetical protein